MNENPTDQIGLSGVRRVGLEARGVGRELPLGGERLIGD